MYTDNMKIPKPIRAFAIVKTSNPKLKVSEIYDTKDLSLEKGEKLIEVVVTTTEKIDLKKFLNSDNSKK